LVQPFSFGLPFSKATFMLIPPTKIIDINK